ncbi:hypothetical protein BT93_L4828 [Corymbia citriodora subsp. variegata]|uniref:Dynactin subunit 6 n=1 Tax=Corymbia citriodora subsp. variegata TaxID=360336 RepID=A0A8T0CJC9_CORYI|nr:hypothetical protein BT93_L4828 [Corymbia citriodora subsp. variegata]
MSTSAAVPERRHPNSTSSTRAVAPAAPRPPCYIHPKAIISEKASITGTHPVTIGENSVIHPYARLSSAVGAVTIGKNCIIADRATVGLVDESADHGQLRTVAVELEDSVTVESNATVEAELVGTGSVIEVYATLRPGTVIGQPQFCKISARCEARGTKLPDYTIIFGEGQQRVDTTTKARADVRDLKLKGQLLHIETLKRLIPSNTAKWQM